MRRNTLAIIGGIAGALALAGCSSTNAPAAPAAGNPATTVSARDIAGVGTILVTSAGDALYFADQESSGTIHCVDTCARVWIPLTVATGQTAKAGTGVGGRLATVNRPDGPAQVTYDGKPLYTFVQDGGPGHADANGATDNFNGTQFQWHAVTVSGSAAPSPATDGGGYGY